MSKHIYKRAGAPNFAPPQIGHHYIDLTSGDQYLSKGTSTAADWVLISGDDKVKVAVTDTTAGYLLDKVSAGSGIVLTEQNIGGNEKLQIAVTGAVLTDEKVKVSATDTTTGYLQGKLVAGTGISLTQQNAGGNETFSVSTTVTQYTDELAQDAVGGILTDTASIDFTYNDAGNQITAVVLPAGVDHNSLNNFVANKHIDHSTVSISAGTGLSGGGDITTTRTLSIANTAVTAASYGSTTQVATFAVNAQGQLTAATNATIAVPSTQITDFTEAVQDVMGGALVDSASVDFQYNDVANTQSAVVLPAGVNHDALQNWVANKHIDHSAVSITAGTGLSGGGDITTSRTLSIPNSGVTASTYGSATQVPVFAVNALGFVTSASNTSIAIPSTQITDFAEAVDDRVAALAVAGTGMSITYNDPANTLTFATTVTQYTDEQAQDAAATLIQNGTGISWSYNDALNTLTPTVSLSPFTTTNLAEGTNLYYTDTRARAAHSVTDSSSIDFTYTSATGVLTGIVLPAGVDHNSLNNFVANKHIDHSTVSLIAGTGISATGLGDLTSSRTINLANTAVTSASYGSATQVATFAVNAQGQLTAAANTTITIPSTAVTDFGEAAQDAVGGILTDTSSVDFTYNDAGNQITAVVLPAGVNHDALQNWVANKHIDHNTVSLIAGTGISATGLGDLTANRTINLTNTGVSTGTYGDSSSYPVITVDAQGRITSASTSSTISYPFVSTAEGPLWQNTTGLDLLIEQINNDPEQSPFIQQRKSRGTSPATRTFLQSGDKIGSFGYMAWGGTDYNLSSSAEFQTRATENHTASAQGSEIRFQNTPNGTTSSSIRMTIKEYGDVNFSNAINIGTTTDTTDGDIRYTGTEFQGRQNGSWVPLHQVPTYLSETASTSTTSATFATISGMTTTPAAGTYKLDFTCSAGLSSNNSSGDFSVFIAGSEQAQCRRTIANGGNVTKQGSVAISTMVTVNGSQAVNIRFRENAAATLTVNARELILTPTSR